MVRVAVIGCGYWGPNLLRNFIACPDTEVVAACDRDPERLRKALGPYPSVDAVGDLGELLMRTDIDAVAIATPVATHEPIVAAALEAGKHVLVEKPMAMTVRGAERVVRMARDLDRILMVDHTYVYSPSIDLIKELIDRGDLGEIFFIDSVRINWGLFQPDINVIWDLATHDLSIIDHLLGRTPRSLSATGSCHTGNEIEDVGYLSMDFGGNLMASVHVNWLSPVKVRHLIIGGSRKSLVLNDLDRMEPIKIFDRGIEVGQAPGPQAGPPVGYRTGDIWSPHVRNDEPLQRAVSHFAQCIREGQKPMSDGEAGLRVVRVLEAAQRSIKAQGGRIVL